ncbi:MAG TPA: tRNA (adenosine(37)-N6)-threonylcarbamoyltransferase complex dimerization subunit type 1 TsaB [Rhodospirillaceae bacterium]|nr:tRNA (adenosine(37)-N6)-threonylcarbamoyltransferase complex dimerization subunit type 1 TsaB [Rhodospirillaceae bacterium]
MKLLAFDTATTGCSAALFLDGRMAAHRAAAMARGQSEALMPMIAEVLAEGGCSYGDLDALAVTVGPGAFTGLRIGLSAAHGLALALAVPCAGVTTLEAVAHTVPEAARAGGRVLVALDSKRADLYVQMFDENLTPLTEPAAMMTAALAEIAVGGPLVIVGDAAPRALEALAEVGIAAFGADAPGVPDAAVVGEIALARALPPVGQAPGPIYLRPPDAIRPKDGGRLRP